MSTQTQIKIIHGVFDPFSFKTFYRDIYFNYFNPKNTKEEMEQIKFETHERCHKLAEMMYAKNNPKFLKQFNFIYEVLHKNKAELFKNGISFTLLMDIENETNIISICSPLENFSKKEGVNGKHGVKTRHKIFLNALGSKNEKYLDNIKSNFWIDEIGKHEKRNL